MKNKKLIDSFRYALTGIGSAFKTERNIKIHVAVASIVTILGIILKLKTWEWVVCVGWFAIVIGGELFNTAIEIAVDLAMPKINEKAKRAKDISAGGVLVFAIGSIIVGVIIFISKIINLIIKIINI
jgi:diacylglycerol kinase